MVASKQLLKSNFNMQRVLVDDKKAIDIYPKSCQLICSQRFNRCFGFMISAFLNKKLILALYMKINT